MGLVTAPALCSEQHRMPKRCWARPTEGHGGEERRSKYHFVVAHLIPTQLISLLSSALVRHSSRPASSLASNKSPRPPIDCSSYSAMTESRQSKRGTTGSRLPTDPRRRRSGSQLGRGRPRARQAPVLRWLLSSLMLRGYTPPRLTGRHHLRGEPRCHAGTANRASIEVDGDQCRDNEQPEPRPQKPA